MLALPIFTGSEPTAACGGRKEVSEWQGSVCNAGACAKAHTGHPNREDNGNTARPICIKKPPPKWMEVKYVRVTYFHGQLPGNYRRRMCA